MVKSMPIYLRMANGYVTIFSIVTYPFAIRKWVCYNTKDWSETYLQQVEIPVPVAA